MDEDASAPNFIARMLAKVRKQQENNTTSGDLDLLPPPMETAASSGERSWWWKKSSRKLTAFDLLYGLQAQEAAIGSTPSEVEVEVMGMAFQQTAARLEAMGEIEKAQVHTLCVHIATLHDHCMHTLYMQDVLQVLLPSFLQRAAMLQAGRDGDSPVALPARWFAAHTNTEEAAPAEAEGRPTTAEARATADAAWLRFVAAVAAAEAATRVRAAEDQPAAETAAEKAIATGASQAAEGPPSGGQGSQSVDQASAAATEARRVAEGAEGELPLQEEGEQEQAREQAARPRKSKKKKKKVDLAATAATEPSEAPPAATPAPFPATTADATTSSSSVREGDGFQAEIPPYDPGAPDEEERNDVLESIEFFPLTAPPNGPARGAAASPSP